MEFENPKIDFVYIRTTMGTNGVDAAFDYNFKEATKHQRREAAAESRAGRPDGGCPVFLTLPVSGMIRNSENPKF